MTYSEKLKDPRWQKRRLEVLALAGWKCQECGSETKTLNVHHGYYTRGLNPWDYPAPTLRAVCDDCHEMLGEALREIHSLLAKLNHGQLVDANFDLLERLSSDYAPELIALGRDYPAPHTLLWDLQNHQMEGLSQRDFHIVRDEWEALKKSSANPEAFPDFIAWNKTRELHPETNYWDVQVQRSRDSASQK